MIRPPRPEHLRRIRRKLDDDGVCSAGEATALTGSDGLSILKSLEESGFARSCAQDIYCGPKILDDDPRVLAALHASAIKDESGRRIIEAVATEDATPTHAILRLWDPPENEGRTPIKRIYFSIQGYPPFYAQKVRPASETKTDILWDSAHHTLGPREAELLGRSVFPSPELQYSDIKDALSGDREMAVEIPESPTSCFGKDFAPAPVSPHMHHMMPCAYVVSDADALDPARLKHPLPQRVALQVSRSQPAVLINTLKKVPNLSVIVTDATAINFTVPGRMVASRITADEFEDMLRDGPAPLIEMADQLADTGLHRSIFIEGGPFAARTFPLPRLASTLSYLQNVHRIHVVPTMNQRHSIYSLVQAIKHTVYGLSDDATAKDDAIPVAERAPAITALAMLRAVPGISSSKASAIASTFPDLRSIALASHADLMKVEGIGPSLADAIYNAFASPLTSGEEM